MSGEAGLPIEKPVKVWHRPIKANYRELFKSLGKAAVDGTLQNWNNLGLDLVEASAAMGLGEEPGKAWPVAGCDDRAMHQAIYKLLYDNKEILVKQPQSVDALSEQISDKMESLDLTIDAKFFQAPKQLPPLVQDMRAPLVEWLTAFVKKPAEAEAMGIRLPSYFLFALHEEWRQRPNDYACLETQVDSPFTPATEQERSWQRYRAWLQKQVEEPMFLEAFGLKQVYVTTQCLLHSYSQPIVRQRDDLSISRWTIGLSMAMSEKTSLCP